MKTIECMTLINEKRQALIQFPPDISLGTHRLVVTLDPTSTQIASKPDEELPTISVGKWTEDLTLRREDFYGNNGR